MHFQGEMVHFSVKNEALKSEILTIIFFTTTEITTLRILVYDFGTGLFTLRIYSQHYELIRSITLKVDSYKCHFDCITIS